MGVMKPPPAGLAQSGRALWRETLSEYGLNPAESLMLTQLCRAADRLDAIETELSGADLTVEGSTGHPVAHPLLAEWRATARAAESLARAAPRPMPAKAGGPVRRR